MIRKATHADLPALVAQISALAAHHGDRALVTQASLARDLFGQPPWLQGFVAVDADEAVKGYTMLTQLVRLHYGQRGMDIHHLFVSPGYRGHGLGKALLQAALSHAKVQECSYVTVSAIESNQQAQQFYLAQGFHSAPVAGIRFGYDLAKLEAVKS